MKIALLTIATNKYIQFAQPLYESVEKHFLKGHTINVFLFTNQVDPRTRQHSKEVAELLNAYPPLDPSASGKRVSLYTIEQPHMPWPYITLKRYHIFQRINHSEGSNAGSFRAFFDDFDYVYYSDIDMLFVDDVGEEIFGDLVATCHPGFYNKPRHLWTYENRPASRACVAPHEGRMYFAGGFQGGSAKRYCQAMRDISRAIDDDLQRGIIAVWHDESHWNRYLIDNPPDSVLSPSYCYPESWAWLPFPRKLLALDKNHKEMRS